MAEKISTSTSTASTKATTKSIKQIGDRSNQRRIVQNYVLVWLDPNVITANGDSQHTLEQLQSVVNDVNLFLEPDDCVDFLTDVQLEKVFLIVSGSLGRDLVPCIHPMTQINAMYIFCGDSNEHEEWVKQWPKVKGVHTQIATICKALQRSVRQCNQDSISVSFAPINGEDASDQNLNQLEPSFMYTQLFKQTLLEMEHDREKEVQDLVRYCQQIYDGIPSQLELVRKFGHEYREDQAISWYTRDSFAYRMLNRALRLLEADIIVNMGFFIHDLHQQIQQLHNEQVGRYGGKPFVVYRGQGLSISDFEKLKKSRGGLMSFNCFLSTSTNKEASMIYAGSSTVQDDRIGILFIITVDPTIASTPFADIRSSSQFEEEAEILFSMHTVFRIDDIQPIDTWGTPVKVNLIMTTDDDTQLHTLMASVDAEIQPSCGWERMANLLIKVGQPDKAEELYYTLLEQTTNREDQGGYYHQLGYVKNHRGDHKGALIFYERALELIKKSLATNHPNSAASYNNIGAIYMSTGEYSTALSFYERALEIWQKSLPANHPDLGTSYSNIGGVYESMGEYSKALSLYQQALEIWKKSLPANHPDLGTSYSNIGGVYENMGEYSKALSFYDRALQIGKKSLPADHPDLACSYHNIGVVYKKMGEHSKALSFFEPALEIQQKGLSANHPSLAASYNNIGSVYVNMGESSKALSLFEQALEIWKKSLPANHPDLGTSYSNIGGVYENMGEHLKALSFYEQALEIRQKGLPTNHPDLGTSYNNIGAVYVNTGEYSKALFFYEQALEIRQKSLSDNHPALAASYNNIGLVYHYMGESSKALSLFERTLEIRQKSLPAYHPDSASCYNNIGLVYHDMGEYSKALSFYEKALKIRQECLPANHPDWGTSYNNIGSVYHYMGEYLKALSLDRCVTTWVSTRQHCPSTK